VAPYIDVTVAYKAPRGPWGTGFRSGWAASPTLRCRCRWRWRWKGNTVAGLHGAEERGAAFLERYYHHRPKAVSVCARPLALALLDQIPLAMEIYVFKCLVSAYVDRSAQRFFWGEGRRTRSSGLTSHGLLALVPHPHLSLSDQGFIAHTNWPHQNIMCQV
jgi:hypothetical protein